MITIFTHCKAFKTHIATIQRNAITSWLQLHSSCEVILFGDNEGTAEAARELGVRHVPEVAKNQYNAPLLNNLLEKTERLASHDLLCYMNCDIILGGDFIRAVEKVRRWRTRFLMIGECWNLDLTELLAFDQPDWEKRLQSLVSQCGRPRGPYANDYFVFPRGFYKQLPPFALGRAAFDHWLIWKARSQRATVVDATQAVMAVHQNHDYSHVPGGKSQVREGEDARYNIELAGGRRHFLSTLDATHRITQAGIQLSFTGYFRLRSRRITMMMIPSCWRILEFTRPIRHRMGLHMVNWERFKARLTR